MPKCFPPKLKSRKKCKRRSCLRLCHKILLALHTIQCQCTCSDGVTEKELINYLNVCSKVDGDVEDQVRTTLNELTRPGYILRCRNRLKILGATARVQCAPFNSPKRQKAVEHVTKIYKTCDETKLELASSNTCCNEPASASALLKDRETFACQKNEDDDGCDLRCKNSCDRCSSSCCGNCPEVKDSRCSQKSKKGHCRKTHTVQK